MTPFNQIKSINFQFLHFSDDFHCYIEVVFLYDIIKLVRNTFGRGVMY